jgi:hypothetical protein
MTESHNPFLELALNCNSNWENPKCSTEKPKESTKEDSTKDGLTLSSKKKDEEDETEEEKRKRLKDEGYDDDEIDDAIENDTEPSDDNEDVEASLGLSKGSLPLELANPFKDEHSKFTSLEGSEGSAAHKAAQHEKRYKKLIEAGHKVEHLKDDQDGLKKYEDSLLEAQTKDASKDDSVTKNK